MNYPVYSQWEASVTYCPVCGNRIRPSEFIEECAACDLVVHSVCSAYSNKYKALICSSCWREYRE